MRDATDLKKIKQLFDTCEPLSQSERETVFAESHLDRQLIDEVKRLLAISDDEQPEEQQANIIGLQLQDLTQNLETNHRLGIYRVEREIGRGGMGIVFLAHRDDGSYQQQVAIKIAPSFASEEELKHFHRERQILAQLQHPNIAMLLDGGTTPEQRPYLVMEYVQGVTITDYCDQHQLDLRRRLKLFLAVCDAVSFAHNHLVIHRDIKPENVLVTAEGKVKLLDFGVSKIMNTGQSPQHTTRLSGLTPAYASPEQLAGKATSMATDVYGLGTLLYRMLSGTTPHQNENASTEQLIRAICEKEPAAVSKAAARSGSAIKQKSLKGDIDNITATALRKEPQNRFASVGELHSDVARFLRGDPVMATPPGFLYRSSKLIRRYPFASALALTVFVTVSGGLGASAYLANKLRLERDNLLVAKAETERQAEIAQRVTKLLTEMFDAASPAQAQGHTIDVGELLQGAARKTRSSLNEEPAVKAQLLNTLAQVSYNSGKYRQAVELQLEALALIPEPASTKKSDRAIAYAHAQADSLIRLGRYYREIGEMDSAGQKLSQAFDLLNQYPDVRLKARALHRKGQLVSRVGTPDQAIEILKQAQDLWGELPDKGAELGFAARHSLSNAYFNKADFSMAARTEEAVLADRIAHLGDTHPDTLNSYRFVARSYMRVGRWNEAQKLLEHAYHTSKNIFSRDSKIYRHTAIAYARLKRRLGYHQLALEILSDLLSEQSEQLETTAELLNHRGYTYFLMGMYTESRRDLEKSNAILSNLYPSSADSTLLPRANLGYVMTATGNLDAGVALINAVMEDNIAMFGQDDYGVAAWNLMLARVALRENDLEKARDLTELSRTIFLKTYGRGQPQVLETDEVDVAISMAQGDAYQATAQCDALLNRFKKIFPADAPIIAKYEALLNDLREQNENPNRKAIANAAPSVAKYASKNR